MRNKIPLEVQDEVAPYDRRMDGARHRLCALGPSRRLARVARPEARRHLHGKRTAQTVAGRGSQAGLASQRRGRRLFHAGSGGRSRLSDGQQGHGGRVCRGAKRQRRPASLAGPRRPVGPNKGPQYPGARSTPTVDGTLVFALGSDGDLVCLDAASGAHQVAQESAHRIRRPDGPMGL